MEFYLEDEIIELIADLRIEAEVKIYSGDEKRISLLKLKELFVNGNPRVWWLSLKYVPDSFNAEGAESYKRIVNFFKENEDVWFVIEEDDQILCKTKVRYVLDIIGNCTFFEYNIISDDYSRFLCETDHNEFLYIDVKRNVPREKT